MPSWPSEPELLFAGVGSLFLLFKPTPSAQLKTERNALHPDERIAVISISFFSSAATVIPTLLVGIVFTGKLMDNWQLKLDEKISGAERKGRIAEYLGGITFVGWLLLASIVGEGAALAALVSGAPRFSYLVLVVVAISFQLTCLGAAVPAQAVSRVEKHDPQKATRGYILMGVGIVIFLSLIVSATVSPATFNGLFK